MTRRNEKILGYGNLRLLSLSKYGTGLPRRFAARKDALRSLCHCGWLLSLSKYDPQSPAKKNEIPHQVRNGGVWVRKGKILPFVQNDIKFSCFSYLLTMWSMISRYWIAAPLRGSQ